MKYFYTAEIMDFQNLQEQSCRFRQQLCSDEQDNGVKSMQNLWNISAAWSRLVCGTNDKTLLYLDTKRHEAVAHVSV